MLMALPKCDSPSRSFVSPAFCAEVGGTRAQEAVWLSPSYSREAHLPLAPMGLPERGSYAASALVASGTACISVAINSFQQGKAELQGAVVPHRLPALLGWRLGCRLARANALHWVLVGKAQRGQRVAVRAAGGRRGQKWLSWMRGAQRDLTESHGPAQRPGPDGPTGSHPWALRAEGFTPIRALQAAFLVHLFSHSEHPC